VRAPKGTVLQNGRASGETSGFGNFTGQLVLVLKRPGRREPGAGKETAAGNPRVEKKSERRTFRRDVRKIRRGKNLGKGAPFFWVFVDHIAAKVESQMTTRGETVIKKGGKEQITTPRGTRR